MFIVFDSNIWVSEFGLQSKNGAAVRLFARMHEATVVIPEVVEVEVEHRLTERLLQSRATVEKGHTMLSRALGSMPPIQLPSEEEIRVTVKERMLSLDVPTRRVALNANACRSSLMKLVQKKPPATGRGGFRDGVIWAHCLDLLVEGDVYLVSNDRDFYENRRHGCGLAEELTIEMKERSKDTQVKLLPGLRQLLASIRVPIDLSVSDVVRAVNHSERRRIAVLLRAHGFGRTGTVTGSTECFATEMATEVYFSFDIQQECMDAIGEGHGAAELTMAGFGFLDSDSKSVKEVHLSNIKLTYPEWNSARGPGRGTVFASGTTGRSQVAHQVRIPLESE